MRKLALLFPGQGSQYIGMGKSLYERFPIAKAALEEANDVLRFDLRKLMLEGDPAELTRTENAQPALLAASVAAYRVYMEEIGVSPSYAAGHSLGEFSALTCAGVLKYADALRMVRRRGELMQEAAAEGAGVMCAIVGPGSDVIEAVCAEESGHGGSVVVSNYNSPDQSVISGERSAVERAAVRLEGEGARIAYLNVSAPFHSPAMEPAARAFREELESYSFQEWSWPVISNVTAVPYASRSEIADRLASQLTAPVRWRDSMAYLARVGTAAAVELGAQNVLSRLMPRNAATITCYSLDRAEDTAALAEALSEEIAAQKHRNKLHNVVTLCITAAICTRNRNEDIAYYERHFVQPYRRLQQLQEELDRAPDGVPTLEQGKEALALLKGMLAAKNVPEEERRDRFRSILEKSGTAHLYSPAVMS